MSTMTAAPARGIPTPDTAEAFAATREHLGLSHVWLSQHLGCSHRTIARWEQGQQPVPEAAAARLRQVLLDTARAELGWLASSEVVIPVGEGVEWAGGWPVRWQRGVAFRVMLRAERPIEIVPAGGAPTPSV